MGLTTATLGLEGHIFLSHAGMDTHAARQLAEMLRRCGLDVWFDKDDIPPGDQWMDAIETAVNKASAMIVYAGRLGVQHWVDREVRLGLVRNTRDPRFRIVPVLAEGAKLDIPMSLLPALLCAGLTS